MLWDLKLKVGHSSRTIADCIRQGRDDITIRTALLEHRFIIGDAQLARDLDARLWSDLFRNSGPEFIEAKLAERAERHKRQGGQRYVLEPNVKEAKGGLRDLQTLYSVSYTHLDVYKRQGLNVVTPVVSLTSLLRPSLLRTAKPLLCPESVSYTHLDVYKRQPVICLPTSVRRIASPSRPFQRQLIHLAPGQTVGLCHRRRRILHRHVAQGPIQRLFHRCRIRRLFRRPVHQHADFALHIAIGKRRRQFTQSPARDLCESLCQFPAHHSITSLAMTLHQIIQ